jgi:predicted dithiol-disulfide oxidoreductase (DUF899 family)
MTNYKICMSNSFDSEHNYYQYVRKENTSIVMVKTAPTLSLLQYQAYMRWSALRYKPEGCEFDSR